MSFMHNAKPFPIPVVTSPGLHMEDETLDYIAMPQGMETYRTPILPEPQDIARCTGAVGVLHALVQALRAVVDGQPLHAPVVVSLQGLDGEDIALLNQVLGEGEVGAQVVDEAGVPQVRIQESVFAGVWRVIETLSNGSVRDTVQVAAVPEILREVARQDGAGAVAAAAPLPPQVMNVPSVLVELEDQRRSWQPGAPTHVVNLSLLPLTPQDIAYLDHRLGTGRVLILSRGYGNCRITNCCVPHTWRVVYYNSQDAVILNSVEVTDMPEVACAASEDLSDSLERLMEVVQWVQQT